MSSYVHYDISFLMCFWFCSTLILQIRDTCFSNVPPLSTSTLIRVTNQQSVIYYLCGNLPDHSWPLSRLKYEPDVRDGAKGRHLHGLLVQEWVHSAATLCKNHIKDSSQLIRQLFACMRRSCSPSCNLPPPRSPLWFSQ